MRKIPSALIALFLLLPISSANCQDAAIPKDCNGTMIQAEGDAQTKVRNDLLSIELAFEKDDVSLPQLHQKMQQEAAAALAKAAKNSAIAVKTSGFSIYPVYERENTLRHHHASYQISLETKDFDAGLTLAGAIQPFQVRNLTFSVSPELRKATEKKLLEQAIADLKDNLNIAANSLNAKTISMVNLTIGNRQYLPVQPRMMRDSIAMEAAAPVAAEAGDSQVIITVTGSAVAK